MALPHPAPPGDPLLRFAQNRVIDAARPHAALLRGLHQAARFEHLEMLKDGRQRHLERFRDLGNRSRPAAQPLDDDGPGWIGESLENSV